MYEAVEDPYCYPGTTVLKNRLNLRIQVKLDEFETFITAQRADEPFPPGRLGYAHYRAIHRHLFQDVYAWAGRVRTVRISKGTSTFCYPKHNDREMRRVFGNLRRERIFRGLDASTFARKAAHFDCEVPPPRAVTLIPSSRASASVYSTRSIAARHAHERCNKLDRPAMRLEAWGRGTSRAALSFETHPCKSRDLHGCSSGRGRNERRACREAKCDYPGEGMRMSAVRGKHGPRK
jgi:Fic/DOC family